MNAESSDSHRLLLNLIDKIDLKRKDKCIAFSNLLHYMGKCKKCYRRTINLKYRLKNGMKNLNYQIDHIMYQILINPSIRIYINKIENRITFKIKTGYYLELLRMKLLGSTKSKITKDKNGENEPYLEITEVVLIHCNVAKNSYQQNSRFLHKFVPNKLFRQLLDIFPKSIIFLKIFIFLIQNFHILKFSLQIKVLILQKKKIK